MITVDNLARAFSIGEDAPKDEYRFATVKEVGSGFASVQLSDSPTLTKCATLASVAVGNRVQVCIKANGSCVIVGKVM